MDKTINSTNLSVSASEYDVILAFLRFLRAKKKGVFTAEIVTHKDARYIKIDITDQYRFDISELVEAF